MLTVAMSYIMIFSTLLYIVNVYIFIDWLFTMTMSIIFYYFQFDDWFLKMGKPKFGYYKVKQIFFLIKVVSFLIVLYKSFKMVNFQYFYKNLSHPQDLFYFI